jgi:ribosomal-protein-alanine N-acetyltransferase
MSAHQTPERDWPRLPERAALDWRIGGLADSASVAMLAERAFEPHFREAWTESQIAALLVTSGAWLDLGHERLGAHESHGGPELAAFAMSRQTFDDVELLLCAVAPERRGAGDGRLLILQVAGSARARGARRLFLEVRSSNLPALSLYRSTGFKVEGRRPGYYRTLGGESIDAITLSLTL